MIKAAFFDMDGTLSIPIYPVGDRYQPCMTDEQWHAFNEKHNVESYSWCKPVLFVKRYAQKLKAEDVKLYVLTGVHTDYEVMGKRSFMEKYYPGLFEELVPVHSDAEKVPYMQNYCSQNGLKYSECELIEDTFKNVIEAICTGFEAKHVTNILDEMDANI